MIPGTTVRTITVPGDGVRVGDVIAMGGIPHVVHDMHKVYPGRRRLVFEDNNAYVLSESALIEVTRTFAPGPAATRRVPPRRGNR